MVASTNVEQVRAIYEAWERGDWSSLDWAHPEIEVVFADGPSPGSLTGPAGVTKGWRDFLTAWEGYRTEVDEFRELDNERVLVLVRRSGRGKTSGLDLAQMRPEGADLLHIVDGRVRKAVIYFDREHALADLGLPSGTDHPRG